MGEITEFEDREIQLKNQFRELKSGMKKTNQVFEKINEKKFDGIQTQVITALSEVHQEHKDQFTELKNEMENRKK